MTVLVTGGAGFIGSHVVDALQQRGHAVRVYDRLIDQVHRGSGPRYVPDGVEFVEGDIRDREALSDALQGVDHVIHLAAEVGVGQSMYEIARYVDTNSGGTALLLELATARRHVIRSLVVASSMSCYGEGQYRCAVHGDVAPAPRTEAQLRSHLWELHCPRCGRPVEPVATPETKPRAPSSVYAISKLDQEALALTVGAAYGIDVVALRYFNAYGPRQALSNPYTGVAAIFCGRLLNGLRPVITEDGEQLRDLVHVRDLAHATVLSLDAPRAAGRAINIGSGEPISIREVATTLAGAIGREELEPEVTGRFRVGDIRHCWADTALAASLLGFRPLVRFREGGAAELVDWVRTQTAEDRSGIAAEELRMRGLSA